MRSCDRHLGSFFVVGQYSIETGLYKSHDVAMSYFVIRHPVRKRLSISWAAKKDVWL